ncbi:MAG: hypothetical protein ACXADB_00460 [Candidatus Hermodarchaeia archaeon]|jgi:hypothetical protein
MAKEEDKKKVISKPVKKKAEISIQKYFQLADPPIHAYTRAYLGEEFRGIIKTEDEWEKELKKYNT